MAGISNETIVKFFENETNDDLTSNFVGVFPSNYVTKFISFQKMMIEKNRYPFIIMNADRSIKNGTHCWSFLDLHKRKEIFLFDSFGFEGFKEFNIDNDRNILSKILFGIEKLKKKRMKKVTLITVKFSMIEYEKTRNGHKLTPTAQDLLHLMNEFGKLNKIKDIVKVHLVDDQLQKIETDICGMFQLYFYFNLFVPFENSSIINDKKRSKSTIEKLLNEILSLDTMMNEVALEKLTEEKNIKRF